LATAAKKINGYVIFTLSVKLTTLVLEALMVACEHLLLASGYCDSYCWPP
jgi:hypothetical protein